MPKLDYVFQNDEKFSAQLQLFKTGIGSYASVLGVTPAQVTTQAADADYFQYVLSCQQIIQRAALQWTGWKDIVRAGGAIPPTGIPAVPALPPTVTAVAPGVEERFRALVQQIKKSANYNDTIGKALGIEGPQKTPPDFSTLQPELEASLNGNRVEVDWGWGGNSTFLDACELQVDRGDGKGWIFLAIDTTPGYVDTAPFPAAPAKWSYRAIYRVDDTQVGQWSKPVALTVGS